MYYWYCCCYQCDDVHSCLQYCAIIQTHMTLGYLRLKSHWLKADISGGSIHWRYRSNRTIVCDRQTWIDAAGEAMKNVMIDLCRTQNRHRLSSASECSLWCKKMKLQKNTLKIAVLRWEKWTFVTDNSHGNGQIKGNFGCEKMMMCDKEAGLFDEILSFDDVADVHTLCGRYLKVCE